MTAASFNPPRIALLMQGTRNYERGLLRGIANYSNLHGPLQFHREIPYLPNNEKSPIHQIRDWKPDAVIIRESTPHAYDELLDLPLPILYFPTTHLRKQVCNVIVDDNAVGRLAAQHLHQNGIRNFGFCGMNELFFWSKQRCKGFCEQVAAYGREVSIFESPLGGEFLNWKKDFLKLQKWLEGLPAKTGVLVCTDDFSLLVQEACVAAGRSIPDEIALIGVGNDEAVCELAPTPLSSIQLNTERAGYDALAFLVQQIKSKKSTRKSTTKDIIVSPLKVVPRKSSDATETRDLIVSEAISFVRQHLNQAIGVEDVVAQVGISRRSLYNRFKQETGQTIYAYINEQRLERFTRLLLETNLTISEISYSMGYESDANIARVFQKSKGITPMSYRRKHSSRHNPHKS